MATNGPPYRLTTWALGGMPKKHVDIPITAVFLVLFIASAVTHMTIFQLNKKHGRKFLMSGLLFGFSMARITACILRIASVSLPQNTRLMIAATIFVAAGVVILFVINIIFTQRLIRAMHPNFGWHRAFEAAVKILIALVIIFIIMLITAVVQTYYTLNPRIRKIDRSIQLAGLTYFAIISFLPIPVTIIGLLARRRKHPIDNFGNGHWRTKVIILLTAATLVSFGASYRAGTSWLPQRQMTQPIYPAMHKGAFYVANFTVEIIVLYMYAILRVDKRFHIPDGARNSYTVRPKDAENGWNDSEHRIGGDDESRPHSAHDKTMSPPGSPFSGKDEPTF